MATGVEIDVRHKDKVILNRSAGGKGNALDYIRIMHDDIYTWDDMQKENEYRSDTGYYHKPPTAYRNRKWITFWNG